MELSAKIGAAGSHNRVALVGLGGIGKTQVALEYAYKVRNDDPGCSIFWIYAGTAQRFEESYLGIGEALQIPGIKNERADVKRLAQKWLGQETSGKWLIILDNADDEGLFFGGVENASLKLADYLPYSQNGSILITSRSKKVALKIAGQNMIHLEKLDPSISSELFKECLIRKDPNSEHYQNMAKLLDCLDHLPLAIVQAASYINENDISVTEYLKIYLQGEESQLELLSEKFQDLNRYYDMQNAITQTWLISFNRMRNDDPLATGFLSFMACLDRQGIPKSLLPSDSSSVKVLKALGTLKAYSFITTRNDGQSFDVHRLVHLATRAWLAVNNELKS